MPVQCICLLCHRPFVAYPSELRNGYGKYCSRQCFNQSPHPRIPFVQRFWALVLKTDDCWLWQGSMTRKGYGQFTLDNRRNIPAHRLAYELTYGMILPGILCCHHCDNPACVRPDHLFLGTHGDNIRDMVKKGRHYQYTHPELVARGDKHGTHLHPETRPRGEQVYGAKLTESQVREIRRLWVTEHWPRKQLAAFFSVSLGSIDGIINRKVWKHLT